MKGKNNLFFICGTILLFSLIAILYTCGGSNTDEEFIPSILTSSPSSGETTSSITSTGANTGTGTTTGTGTNTGTGTGTNTGSGTSTGTKTGTNTGSGTSTGTPSLEWCYMIYMCGDNNLCQAAQGDIAEIQSAYSSFSGKCEVIVLFDSISSYCYSGIGSNGKSYLYRVTSTLTTLNASWITSGSTELDMGSQTTLENFLSYCKTNYPAQKYHLTIWNHGDGWRSPGINPALQGGFKGAASDDTSGGSELYSKDMQNALTNQGFTGSSKLALFTFDACLMGSVEIAHHFRNNAEYVGGSAESEPGDGFEYTTLLNTFFSRAAGSRTPLQFGKDLANTYTAQSSAFNTYFISNSNYIHSVALAVDAWATSLGSTVSARKTVLDNANSTAKLYETDYSTPYYDLYQLTLKVSTSSSAQSVAVRAAINAISGSSSGSTAGAGYYKCLDCTTNQRALSIVCGPDPSTGWYTNSDYNSTNIDWAASGEASNYAAIIQSW